MSFDLKEMNGRLEIASRRYLSEAKLSSNGMNKAWKDLYVAVNVLGNKKASDALDKFDNELQSVRRILNSFGNELANF